MSIISIKAFRIIVGTVNVFLSAIAIMLIVIIPKLDDKVNNMFVCADDFEKKLNIYKWKTDDNSSNPEKIIILDNNKDEEDEISKMLSSSYGKEIKIERVYSISMAADHFRSGDGDMLALNEAYANMIGHSEQYKELVNNLSIISTYTASESSSEGINPGKEISEEAVSILVIINGSESDQPYVYGATEACFIITINPLTEQIYIVNIPKDSYVPNPAFCNAYDKIKNLEYDGICNSISGISQYFDIDIDHYCILNYQIIKKIVDLLEGVAINDQIQNGDAVIEYLKGNSSSFEDNNGIQDRAKILLKATLKRLISLDGIKNSFELFDSLENQFITDLKAESFFKMLPDAMIRMDKWEVFYQKLNGDYSTLGTVSMGWTDVSRTVSIFDTQVSFLKEQLSIIKQNRKISNDSPPNSHECTPVFSFSNMEYYLERDMKGGQDIAIYNGQIIGLDHKTLFISDNKYSINCGHGNNCMFGKELHGKFPYLYSGSWIKDECYVFINQISEDGPTLVETLDYSFLSGYLNSCVDEENQRIYILLCISDTTREGAIDFLISDFSGNIISRKRIDNVPVVQGMTFYNGYIYVVSGLAAQGPFPNTLTILDTEGRVIVKNCNTGIYGEFEGIDFYDEEIYIATIDAIYKSKQIITID